MDFMNISRDTMSEMDKIFIPEDLDGNISIEDLATYKYNVKGWRVVPENYSLVAKNIFTQINKNVDGVGIKFIMPYVTKTILVPKYSGIKKYSNIKAYTLDGEELTIDFSVIMKIVNPAKYMVEGKNKLNELNSLIIKLFRIYVSSKVFQTVLRGSCDKRIFDSQNELEDFKDRYGIEIERILVEKVDLSENLRKLYNDTLEEKQRRLAQTERLAAEKAKAENDAVVAKIKYETEVAEIKAIEEAKNNAYVDRISKLIEQLKIKGFTNESIEMYIKTMLLADSGNTIFMGNNLECQNIAGGIVASEKALDNSPKTKTK